MSETPNLAHIVSFGSPLMDHASNFHCVIQRLHECIMKYDSPVLEIGTRLGGSAIAFLKTMEMAEKKNWLYTVDPYAGLPYCVGEQVVIDKQMYPDEFYRRAMRSISDKAWEWGMNWHHFRMKSGDFMDYMYDNFTQYTDDKVSKFDKFCFVFCDGDHHIDTMLQEVEFFMPRLEDEGMLILDDTHFIKDELVKALEPEYNLEFFPHRRCAVTNKP